MNGTQARELNGQRTTLLLNARDLAEHAEQEDRELTTDERTQIEGFIREVADINNRLSGMNADNSLRQQIAALGQNLDLNGERSGPTNLRVGAGPRQARGGTPGQQFVNSEAWQSYLAHISTTGGHIPEKARVESPRVQMPTGFIPRRYSNEVIIEGDETSGGALIIPSQSGIVSPLPMMDLNLLDLITIGQTDSDAVQYVRITDLTGSAAGVAESTTIDTPSPADAAHGVKPWLDLTLERVTANVQNIAAGIPATTRQLSDAAQTRTLIDTYLRSAVREEVQRQVIQGSGTGEEIEGIDTAHTTDQPYSDTLTNSSPMLETSRKALTQIQLARGVTPTGFAFHPSDWETVDLERIDRNVYDDRVSGIGRMLHGYPVVISEAVDEGTAWVGDWRWYVLWMREDVSITASSGYMDFFMRNLVAILGEERAAGGLIRTDAMCKIDLTA